MKPLQFLPSVVGVVFLGSAVSAADPEAVRQALQRADSALRRMQQPDGTWPGRWGAPTSLACLALLENGAAKDDPAIVKAAQAIRNEAPTLQQTYTLALAIIFLDHLSDPADAGLIDALTVRLMTGQNRDGGWFYSCSNISLENARQLATVLKQRNQLTGRSKLPDGKPGDAPKVPEKQPRDVLARPGQLTQVPLSDNPMSDNSNTQFATLALWVARRHAVPVEQALARVEARFRRTQNADGGWSYNPTFGHGGGSTATMTCAGLQGLAIAHGTANARAAEKNPQRDKPPSDPAKDRQLNAGLAALATVVKTPLGNRDGAAPILPPALAGGKAFYFLWSLERVSVALDLKTLGGKDWYDWGCEILLATQQRDGSWVGDYPMGGADTCFGILFLTRANLAKDLTASLEGKIKDAVVLRAGRPGDALRLPPPGEKSAGEATASKPDPLVKRPEGPNPAPKNTEDKRDPPLPAPPSGAEAARLAGERLIKAAPSEQEDALRSLREEKGLPYTESLASAIPQLSGEIHRKARRALADRLARMKDVTLAVYLKDEDVELRRAAALACAIKGNKAQVPSLIPLLTDPEMTVVRAALAALQSLSGAAFGATPEAWQDWWDKQK